MPAREPSVRGEVAAVAEAVAAGESRVRSVDQRPFLIGLMVFAVVGWVYISWSGLADLPSRDALGSAFVPRVGCVLLFVGAAVALWEARTSYTSADPSIVVSAALVPAIAGYLYILGAYHIGFFPTTLVMLAAFLYAGGVRRLWVVAVVTVVATVATYLFFVRLAGVLLPGLGGY